MKSVVKLIVFFAILTMAIVYFLRSGDVPPASAPTEQRGTLPVGRAFPDDVESLHSNLEDENVRLYTHMPEALLWLGEPNVSIKFDDAECPAQPVVVSIYNDNRGYKDGKFSDFQRFALEYRNLHCQPDPRAYVLVGIHPVPGRWSAAARIK